MSSEPIHSYFGTPLSEWLTTVPNELDIDAVGLWQIIPTLRNAFGLKDAALERATREALAGLLARGACPVVGSAAQDGSWEEATRYGDNPAAIIDAVIEEWHRMGRDPDVGDVWFAQPWLFR
jgi:hypothetical protein